jgi:hypothetical protein
VGPLRHRQVYQFLPPFVCDVENFNIREVSTKVMMQGSCPRRELFAEDAKNRDAFDPARAMVSDSLLRCCWRW